MVYSVNQNRHMYIVKAYNATVGANSAVGTIGGFKVSGKGNDKELHFLYKGPDTVIKSDRIQLKNLDYCKYVAAAEMVTPLKTLEITLNADVNEGAPIAGQDYILRIAFRQFYGMSDEDQYFKDAAVHAVKNMTAAAFMTAMKNALDLAFSRETGATKTSNPYLKFEASGNKLVITEKEQPWTLGIGAQEQVLFDVIPTTVYSDGDEFIWGVVTDKTPAKEDAVVGTNAIGNGKKIADLEWFCMGERGDQYRMKGYPNYIPTTYLADATQQYDVIELHHAFTDTGVNSYRSEKDITLAGAAATMASVKSAIETAASITVDQKTSDNESGNDNQNPG